MKNRTFKKIAVVCAAMAVFSYSQTCNNTTLYSGSENGYMEESSRTFPEAPEWKANWGQFPLMTPPYIRLSGQKNTKGDWRGALVFPKSVAASGATLSMKIRSSQNVKFGVWLGNSGEAFYKSLSANESYRVDIPVADIGGKGEFQLKQVWIGLFGVGAYQYTNLFVDDIAIRCPERSGTAGGSSSSSGSSAAGGTSGAVTLSGTAGGSGDTDFIVGGDAASPVRKLLWESEPLEETAARYSTEERDELKKRTPKMFVMDWQDHDRILRFLQSDSLTPQQSREGWYKAMYLVTNSRVKDSVIANPKQLFADANAIAAMNEMESFPLLVANVDYSYKVCTDTQCNATAIENYHLLAAGLPTSYTRSSKVRITYDPFFVTTDKSSLPNVEICVSGKCKALEPNKATEVEFPSAGIQKLTVKLAYGSTRIQQTLSLEVR